MGSVCRFQTIERRRVRLRVSKNRGRADRDLFEINNSSVSQSRILLREITLGPSSQMLLAIGSENRATLAFQTDAGNNVAQLSKLIADRIVAQLSKLLAFSDSCPSHSQRVRCFLLTVRRTVPHWLRFQADSGQENAFQLFKLMVDNIVAQLSKLIAYAVF